jgi:hypothetical protein
LTAKTVDARRALCFPKLASNSFHATLGRSASVERRTHYS